MRPNLNVAKKADARVPGSLVKLVRAVLLTVLDCSFLLKKDTRRVRGRMYLNFGMVRRNTISNKPMWCP